MKSGPWVDVWRLQHLGYEQWCCACARTTHRAQTRIIGIGLVVTQHIGHKLTAVVLGLWSDNTWGMKSHQLCWACSQLDKIRARIYSIGFGLVVRQHIGNELIAVV